MEKFLVSKGNLNREFLFTYSKLLDICLLATYRAKFLQSNEGGAFLVVHIRELPSLMRKSEDYTRTGACGVEDLSKLLLIFFAVKAI